MEKTAASLAVFALEQLGITHTFGIPGVHNTELFDEVSISKKIEPILVTHESGGAFMAEAISRTSKSTNIGTLLIVPAAGFTHAMSGIGEAFLDGIPMLIITGGVRTDTKWQNKLHQIDQLELAKGITKAAFRIEDYNEVIPTIYQAYEIAVSDFPGPVLVEIPVNMQIFSGEVEQMPEWQGLPAPKVAADEELQKTLDALINAKKIGLFVGWGAKEATDELIKIAEFFNAPVATTLQGLSSFPSDHFLHTGFGFGDFSVPASKNAFKDIDLLFTIGARFSEIPTGSFSIEDKIPQTHIHLDIDASAIGANYRTDIHLVGDAKASLKKLVALIENLDDSHKREDKSLQEQIAKDKERYLNSWLKHQTKGKVNPAKFFQGLRANLTNDAIMVLDDGNHTYLAAELFPQNAGGRLLTPTDFNAMGYAVPAALGAKLTNPDKQVVAIVGDGCFTMTCMEILTGVTNKLGVVYFVFKDGELSQISQMQKLPYQSKTCCVLPKIDLKGIAQATGAIYLSIESNELAETVSKKALDFADEGQVVIVDIAIDYSKATNFTKNTVKSNFKTFPAKQKARFVKRIMRRKLGMK